MASPTPQHTAPGPMASNSDAYLDHCARTGMPTGIAANAAALKTFPVEVRSMVITDGIALISEHLNYAEAVAESIRQWREATTQAGTLDV